MSDTELTSGDFTEAAEPFRLFAAWLDDATKSEPNDPNGVALATVDANGMPDVRMVLLKGFDESGFVFYTNFESAKGQEILGSMKAAMCFHWKSLRRQVRIRGPVEIVSDAEADAYYATRPRGSRIGAWASKQSRPLESRFALEKAVAEYT
ncbi:pyridoxamine 5'-phosphate oxidase, partial [Mesorhizobium sp. M7A.T.Ca.TU.009.01.3.2]